MTQAAQSITLDDATDEQLERVGWMIGDLEWLLLDHQVPAYRHYREWEKRNPQNEPGQYARIYVDDIGKRWGKTSKRIVVRMEDCIRSTKPIEDGGIGRPGMFRYTTAYQKDIEEIVGELLPLLLDRCPPDLRPIFKSAHRGNPAGLYFPNGSRIAMAGLDQHPNALRGRGCDGDDLSEAAFVRYLKYTVKNVLYHQYQQRPWARMCLESSAPEEVDTDYDLEFVEDAKLRGAYWYATIDDNTALSDAEREEFIRAAGGRDDPDCQREYFNKRIRSGRKVVVPAFDEARHVRAFDTPEWALCYTFADAAWYPDLFAILWGWVDYERAKICIRSDWTAHNAGTKDVAEIAEAGERECFEGTRRWNGHVILNNDVPPPPPDDGIEVLGRDRTEDDWRHKPYARVMDCEPRLRAELASLGMSFAAAVNKDPDAQFHVLNRLFTDDKIELHPDAVATIAHTRAAVRGPNGKLARSEVHGHYDAMRCLAYAAVMVDWHTDPKPPAWVLDKSLLVTPQARHLRGQREQSKRLNDVYKPRRWQAGAKRGPRA
jgi:hypothetical protein